MILFDDSSWEYNFILLMSAIIIVCGIYTFIKVYLHNKKIKKQNEDNNLDNQKENSDNYNNQL